jgi:hypothetical protein
MKESLQQHMQEISWHGLTKTLKDAIRVTYSLGLRYIWIDSICIIQNDLEDWEREAVMMASVYQGSDLTIAAASSPNSYVGLFLNTVPPALRIDEDARFGVQMLRAFGGNEDEIHESILNQRGWVLQEIVLSRRVVYFTNNQVYWHCQSLLASEDGFLERNDRKVPPNQFVYEQDFWRGLILDYSRRDFTFTTDRLAALVGLIRWEQSSSTRTPVLGMWKESLALDLCWSLTEYEDQRMRKSPILGLPTWTWLYWDSAVNFQIPQILPENMDYYLKILDYVEIWSGEPLISKLQHSMLRVRGLVKKLKLRAINNSSLGASHFGLEAYEDAYCFMDDEFVQNTVVEKLKNGLWVDCLLCAYGWGVRKGNWIVSFLVLQRLYNYDECPSYRRIGMGFMVVAKASERAKGLLMFSEADYVDLELR